VDVDGDEDLDVLSAGGSEISWYENLSEAGVFGPQRVITNLTSSAFAVFAADLDGDGDADVLSASGSDDKIAWYENLDGSGRFGPQQVLGLAHGARTVVAADLDGDGDLDVLSAAQDIGGIRWYENLDGLGTFGAERFISSFDDNAWWVVAVDLDGDGDLDVLGAHAMEDLAWYANLDGSGDFGPPRPIEMPGGPSAAAADLDGDGDVDVLSGGAWYENLDGQGGFGSAKSITSNGMWSVFAADLDGDGDADALVAAGVSVEDDVVAWFENLDGLGTFGPEQLIGLADFAVSVVAADVDGDGDLDALAASRQGLDDPIVWYENTGDRFGDGCDNCPAVGNPDQSDLDGDGAGDACDAWRAATPPGADRRGSGRQAMTIQGR
jgi:hypothetical protein